MFPRIKKICILTLFFNNSCFFFNLWILYMVCSWAPNPIICMKTTHNLTHSTCEVPEKFPKIFGGILWRFPKGVGMVLKDLPKDSGKIFDEFPKESGWILEGFMNYFKKKSGRFQKKNKIIKFLKCSGKIPEGF